MADLVTAEEWASLEAAIPGDLFVRNMPNRATAHWHDLPKCEPSFECPQCAGEDMTANGVMPHGVRELHAHPFTDLDHPWEPRA